MPGGVAGVPPRMEAPYADFCFCNPSSCELTVLPVSFVPKEPGPVA